MSAKTNWSQIERDTRNKAHAKQVADLQDQIKARQERIDDLNAQLEVAMSIRREKPESHKIAACQTDESEATAFALAGDWHVEETVSAKAVNGLNEFNLEVAEKRIDKFFSSVVRLVEIQRAGTRVDNLVLCLLGDMMTGYIHEELQESNGLSPTQTVIWLRSRISSGLKFIKSQGGFKRIVVTANYGNHGRTTKKVRHATGAANSYEWMMYHMMKDDVPGVEWIIADGYFIFLDVYGRVYRIHHGDNIQYQGGIGGITIPAEKAIASWNKANPVYMDLFGHHHTAIQHQRWICNGPLIGYNPFSIAVKAAYEPPQQTLFLVDSKRGRTGTWPIFLS